MKLSIIITNFRQSADIMEMLSRVKIPNEDVEIIVVDDCSNDPYLDELEFRLSRLCRHSKVVRCRTKVCCGGARNVGVNESAGEWLWFVDGDDAIARDAIPRVLAALDSAADVDCFVLDYSIESRASSEVVSFCGCRPADRLKLWEVGIMAWFKVIRRDAYVPFRAAFSEDNDWWVRQCVVMILRRGGRHEYRTVDGGPCYRYRKLAPGAFTSALDRVAKSRDVDSAVRAIVAHPDSAASAAAVLRTLAELVELTHNLIDSNMPDEFITHHKFTLRWWLDRLSKIGGGN